MILLNELMTAYFSVLIMKQKSLAVKDLQLMKTSENHESFPLDSLLYTVYPNPTKYRIASNYGLGVHFFPATFHPCH